jgi:hypothetical protein
LLDALLLLTILLDNSLSAMQALPEWYTLFIPTIYAVKVSDLVTIRAIQGVDILCKKQPLKIFKHV